MTASQETTATPINGHSLLWSVIALLTFILIAVAGYNYSPQQSTAIIATAPLNPDCLINEGPCSAKLEKYGDVTLNIEPRPLIATTPMQVSIQTRGMEAREVEINFRGESMNMGLNQFRLLDQGNGKFIAQAILPVCVRSSMFWIADVMVRTPQGTVVFPFRLETVHP